MKIGLAGTGGSSQHHLLKALGQIIQFEQRALRRISRRPGDGDVRRERITAPRYLRRNRTGIRQGRIRGLPGQIDRDAGPIHANRDVDFFPGEPTVIAATAAAATRQ